MMTIVITRDVAPRIRGFLASVLLEVAPGVYVAPKMTVAVRERIWAVVESWFDALGGGSVVMAWRAQSETTGMGVRTLGLPPRELVEVEGVFLVRAVSRGDGGSLTSE